jgi:hypothetical protein
LLGSVGLSSHDWHFRGGMGRVKMRSQLSIQPSQGPTRICDSGKTVGSGVVMSLVE